MWDHDITEIALDVLLVEMVEMVEIVEIDHSLIEAHFLKILTLIVFFPAFKLWY